MSPREWAEHIRRSTKAELTLEYQDACERLASWEATAVEMGGKLAAKTQQLATLTAENAALRAERDVLKASVGEKLLVELRSEHDEQRLVDEVHSLRAAGRRWKVLAKRLFQQRAVDAEVARDRDKAEEERDAALREALSEALACSWWQSPGSESHNIERERLRAVLEKKT